MFKNTVTHETSKIWYANAPTRMKQILAEEIFFD